MWVLGGYLKIPRSRLQFFLSLPIFINLLKSTFLPHVKFFYNKHATSGKTKQQNIINLLMSCPFFSQSENYRSFSYFWIILCPKFSASFSSLTKLAQSLLTGVWKVDFCKRTLFSYLTSAYDCKFNIRNWYFENLTSSQLQAPIIYIHAF